MARKTIVDVFDENFAKAVDSAIEDVTQEWREDPWCIGYFVDNELQWGQGDRERGYDLPRNVLASTGDLAAKGEFVSRLRENYGEIEKLNNAWGITVESWEQFADKPVSLPKEPSKALVSDQSDFLSHFARRYFTVVRDAMKRHAPNQLYLGCRIASRAPEEVARLQAEFADVVSYNWYCRPENFVERTAAAAALGRPVIIGEFHFGATDRGMFHTGLGPVANQEERGKSYAAYVAEALKQPWCVGAHWFTYIDEPLTGRFDGENYNIGFMNVTDTPYPELSAAAREINFRIYEIRGRQ